MQTLDLTPPIPYLWPIQHAVSIALIGCGGTGSHLAQTLAKIAVHRRSIGGPELELLFVDGDLVEQKNVGRQLFSPSDIGKNKAEVLAARFNAVFGLQIAAQPSMLTAPLRRLTSAGRGILVGAVDNAAARQQIAASLHHWGPKALWIDCGNHEHSGQVLVGSTAFQWELAKACAVPSMCVDLPSPALVAPELLVPPTVQPIRAEDCAAAMEDNRQSLLINQAMATIAGQYLANLLFQGQITTFETIVDLESLSMRSTPITAATIARYAAQATAGAAHAGETKRFGIQAMAGTAHADEEADDEYNDDFDDDE